MAIFYLNPPAYETKEWASDGAPKDHTCSAGKIFQLSLEVAFEPGDHAIAEVQLICVAPIQRRV